MTRTKHLFCRNSLSIFDHRSFYRFAFADCSGFNLIVGSGNHPISRILRVVGLWLVLYKREGARGLDRLFVQTEHGESSQVH